MINPERDLIVHEIVQQSIRTGPDKLREFLTNLRSTTSSHYTVLRAVRCAYYSSPKATPRESSTAGVIVQEGRKLDWRANSFPRSCLLLTPSPTGANRLGTMMMMMYELRKDLQRPGCACARYDIVSDSQSKTLRARAQSTSPDRRRGPNFSPIPQIQNQAPTGACGTCFASQHGLSSSTAPVFGRSVHTISSSGLVLEPDNRKHMVVNNASHPTRWRSTRCGADSWSAALAIKR